VLRVREDGVSYDQDDDGRAMQELDAERLQRTLETLDRVQAGEANDEDVAFLAAELGVSEWMQKPSRGYATTSSTNFNLFQQEMTA